MQVRVQEETFELEETLTIMRLDLPEGPTRVLASTNLIESLFSRVRDISRCMRRWQDGTMILRWTGAGVLEAERHFRKAVGYRSLPKLDAALRAHDAALENRKQVALNDYSAATDFQQRIGHSRRGGPEGGVL